MQGVFLLSIGDELLDGRTPNTNATYFGEELRLAGVPVHEIRSVSDRVSDIVKALHEARKAPLVIVTGGLGPTSDDRTMEAAARAFKTKLVETKASLTHVKKRYEARGLPLTEHRRRLALIPKGAKILENSAGTAPGIGYKNFFFLPGPPNECRPMFERAILPLAKKLAPRKLARREFWRTFGRGESDVYQRVAPFTRALEEKYPDTVSFGVHISFPCIDLTLEVWKAKGKKSPTPREIDRVSAEICKAVGELCFTRERKTLAEVVFELLREKQKTLALAESCTGGLVAKLLTDFPGSSEVFLGGVVSYANEAKESCLQVQKETLTRHGAVSLETVKEMAEGIRNSLRADYALAISGISGPGGGTKDKPVGTTCVALSSKKGTETKRHEILSGRGTRDQNRVIAAHLALDALRLELLGFHANRFPLSSGA